MSRLEKKCLVAASGLHLLLLVAGSVGAAFVKDQPALPNPDDVVITILNPDKLYKPTDGPTVTVNPGGAAAKPAAQPVESKPTEPVISKPPPKSKPPEPEEVAMNPDPPKPVVKPPAAKPTKKDPEPSIAELEKFLTPEQQQPSFTGPTVKKPTTAKPEAVKPVRKFDFANATSRVTKDEGAAKRAAEASAAKKRTQELQDAADAKAYEEATERAAQWRKGVLGKIGGASSGIKNNTEGRTQVDIGGVGSGVAMANYTDLVYHAYYRAWTVPDGTDSNATVHVRVVVERDGSITSAALQNKSGNASMDKSVENALRRVPSLPAFPPSAKEAQRTFNIKFNLKSKQDIG